MFAWLTQWIKLIYCFQENGITKNDITTVSIHVRLTDYKTHLSHNYNMSTVSEEYLTTAMEYMSNKYKVNKFPSVSLCSRKSNISDSNSGFVLIILFWFQNVLFYVLSDDVIIAKKIFHQGLDAKFYIVFPGNSQAPLPGNIQFFIK